MFTGGFSKRFSALSVTLSLSLLWAIFPAALSASTITIDHFGDPTATEFTTVGGADQPGGYRPYLAQQPYGYGGQRDILLDVQGTGGTSSANGFVGNHGGSSVLQIGSGGPEGTVVTLQYDGTPDPEPNWTSGSLTDVKLLLSSLADLTSGGTNSLLRLTFLNVQPGVADRLPLQVIVAGASSQAVFTADATTGVPKNTAPYTASTYDIPFSAFSNPGVLANAQSITLVFNDATTPIRDVDFALDSIEAAVPEPTTLAMLAGVALAAAAVWVRRRSCR